jgi:hypothetical protein
MFGIYRGIAFCQWKGCLFLHIGTTGFYAQVFKGNRCWGLELLTPDRWFALAPFRRLTWRRVSHAPT